MIWTRNWENANSTSATGKRQHRFPARSSSLYCCLCVTAFMRHFLTARFKHVTRCAVTISVGCCNGFILQIISIGDPYLTTLIQIRALPSNADTEFFWRCCAVRMLNVLILFNVLVLSQVPLPLWMGLILKKSPISACHFLYPILIARKGNLVQYGKFSKKTLQEHGKIPITQDVQRINHKDCVTRQFF